MIRPTVRLTAILPTAGWLLLACSAPVCGQAPPSATPVIEDRTLDQAFETTATVVVPKGRSATSRENVDDRPLHRLAAEQRAASQVAFQRGLLPLTDFLEQVTAAYEADLSEATFAARANDGQPPTLRGDLAQPDARHLADVRRAISARTHVLRIAVQELEAFRQPAAEGWSADVSLAKYALADAEMILARVDGRLRYDVRATQPLEQAAREHYLQSVFDHQVLGHGSVPQLVEAVAMLNLSPGITQAAATEGVAVTETFARYGAGLGRDDFVQAARLQRARLETLQPDSADSTRRLSAFREADAFAERLFARQRDYYVRGTASLFDLGRTWRTRLVLHQQADEARATLAPSAVESRRAQLQELTRFAGEVRDTRGRMTSDLVYLELLKQSDDESRTTARTTRKPSLGDYESTPTNEGGRTGARPDVRR